MAHSLKIKILIVKAKMLALEEAREKYKSCHKDSKVAAQLSWNCFSNWQKLYKKKYIPSYDYHYCIELTLMIDHMKSKLNTLELIRETKVKK